MLTQTRALSLSPYKTHLGSGASHTVWFPVGRPVRFITLEKGGPCCDIPAEKQEGIPPPGGKPSGKGLSLQNKTLTCFTPDIPHSPPTAFATLLCLDAETFGQDMVYRTLSFLTGPCICFSPLKLPWPFQGDSSCILPGALQPPDFCWERMKSCHCIKDSHKI